MSQLIPIAELVSRACAQGIHVTLPHVHHAMRVGALVPVAHNPPRFTLEDCNAWLTRLWREDNRL